MKGNGTSTHLATCCDICGDEGVVDLIVTCGGCKVNREHLYCMRKITFEYPETWYCDDCVYNSEEAVMNYCTKDEVAKELSANTCKLLHQYYTQPNKLPNYSTHICMDRNKDTISDYFSPPPTKMNMVEDISVPEGDASKRICLQSSAAVPCCADTFKSCKTILSILRSPDSVHFCKDAENFHDKIGSLSKTEGGGDMHEDCMDMAIEELNHQCCSCVNKFTCRIGEATRRCYILLDENLKLKANIKHMDQRMAELEEENIRLKSKLFGHDIDCFGVTPPTDPAADEDAIKKQSFELACSLDPHKNKLEGTLNACEMIGEAQDMLLDGGTETEETSESLVVIEYEVSSQEIESLDPDFSDFDKGRKKECFAAGQLWAVYDLSCMPRVHAIIRRVLSGPFRLQVTWLEPDPADEEQKKWVLKGLPASCGKFKDGLPGTINEHGIFSHLVLDKVSIGESIYIYPKRGETWALFKGWDTNWHSDPQKNNNFEYEFVEVLSDYEDKCGVDVAYLVKLKGFACLFCRMKKDGNGLFRIPAKHVYRFSHKVPSFRMSGEEHIGVPRDSFELDPASLPSEFDEIDVLTALSIT